MMLLFQRRSKVFEKGCMMILKASIDAGRRFLRNEVEYGDTMKEGCDCQGLLKSGRLEVEVRVVKGGVRLLLAYKKPRP